tara:strand:+ start:400 stop:588 length:189 start_codon:yes stop_codon:yes gene_type:complete
VTKAANILLFGLLVLLLINGLRLTFFPLNACNLVRDNQMPTISESVMEFHREYGDRFKGETE